MSGEATGPRVAAAQYPLDPCRSPHDWARKVEDWVARAAAEGAQLLVFPEYAAIEQVAPRGPEVNADLVRCLDACAELADERAELHRGLAREYGVHLLAGSGPERSEEGCWVNAARLFTPDGACGVQEKLLLTPFEKDWGLSPGRELRVFDTDLGRLGILVCYDCEFPLLARAQVEKGAEILLVPACTERLSGHHRVRTGARARALENSVAVVHAPLVGDADWSPVVDRNTGSAAVLVPSEEGLCDDGVLAEGELGEARWVSAVIPRTRLRRLRTEGEMRNAADWDRQPGAASLGEHVRLLDLRPAKGDEVS